MTEGAHLKPSLEDVTRYMVALSRVVPFFPQDDLGISMIAAAVLKFVGANYQLDWFAGACVDKLAKYDGVAGMRALFCSKFSPDDGEPPIVDVPGLEAEVLEARHAQRVMDENEARMAVYRRQAALAPPEDREPLQLPEAKPIPEGNPLVHRQARALSAGAQLAQVEGAITCSWCAEGFARVRSSVSSNFIHTDTPVGRVVCKNRSADVGVPVTEPAPAPQPPAEGSAS